MLTVLGLYGCVRAFSTCGERAVCGVLTVVVSLVVQRGPQTVGSAVVAQGLSSSEARGIFLGQGSNLYPLH